MHLSSSKRTRKISSIQTIMSRLARLVMFRPFGYHVSTSCIGHVGVSRNQFLTSDADQSLVTLLWTTSKLI